VGKMDVILCKDKILKMMVMVESVFLGNWEGGREVLKMYDGALKIRDA
jgi:hypothetical protein